MNSNSITKRIVALSATVVILIAGAAFFYISHQKKQLTREKEAWVEQERISMEEELQRLEQEYALQYEKVAGVHGEKSITFSNDNLLEQLEQEKNRVAELRQELASVKSDNTRRISELTAEINTLRGVLRSYVNQIDSLYATNQRLSEENRKARDEIAQISDQASELTREKQHLSGIVERAARLSAVGIKVLTLDKRGKATTRIDRITHFSVSFTIPENTTAHTGNKTLYIRVLNPNDLPMEGDKSFTFEGKTLRASAHKEIEYTGEATSVTIYQTIGETLLKGNYRVDIFADGHLIGKQSFSL